MIDRCGTEQAMLATIAQALREHRGDRAEEFAELQIEDSRDPENAAKWRRILALLRDQSS